ncbi:MAG: hypothetical protein ACXWX0_00010 [Actinomycetota bacterium]
MVFALFGVSAPVFWLAYVFLYLFWFKLHWVCSSGIPIGANIWEPIAQARFILP